MKDSSHRLKFSKSENKIRRKWLFWSVLLPGFIFEGGTIAGIFRFFIERSTFEIVFFIPSLLFFSIVFYGNYYCSYKKTGQNFISLGVFFALLHMITIILNVNIGLLYLDALSHFICMKFLQLMDISELFRFIWCILDIFSIYYSYKLVKINRDMEDKKLENLPNYMNALSCFSTTNNLDELNEKFYKLRHSFDSENELEILAKAYDRHRRILQLTNANQS